MANCKSDFIEIEPSELIENPVQVSEDFFLRMSKRRSIREFSKQPVDKAILINAIKTAASAPSGANRQPWYFALVTSQAIKDKIRSSAEAVEKNFYEKNATGQWLEDLKPLQTCAIKPYLSEAPALIAVFSRTICGEPDTYHQRTYYPIESAGISVGLLIASLHNSGLATLTHTPKPMFFLNEVLRLNKSFRPFMIVVTGYPQARTRVPNILRKELVEVMREY